LHGVAGNREPIAVSPRAEKCSNVIRSGCRQRFFARSGYGRCGGVKVGSTPNSWENTSPQEQVYPKYQATEQPRDAAAEAPNLGYRSGSGALVRITDDRREPMTAATNVADEA
jgi:hypothetical protein